MDYSEKIQRVSEPIRTTASGQIRLQKSTSNLFRDRRRPPARPLAVQAFTEVRSVDRENGCIDVEGMTPYASLVDAGLAGGVMPAVVPQLKSITIGGAVSGIGIESSSFKFGLPHETVEQMDILLADGEIITCTAENEHRDLFFGIPNSYGTLGYILRLKLKSVPVSAYVALEHRRYEQPGAFFAALETECSRGDENSFIDGVVFGPGRYYLTLGRFRDQAPYTSDYTHKHIYYRSIAQRETDYLSTRDYIWRWDTDWFWCSRNLMAQNPLVRRLLGRKRLNSMFYTRVMRWNAKWGLTRRWNHLLGYQVESVIQDVDIPIARAAEFLEFFLREIPITPVWICPIGHYRTGAKYPLYPLSDGQLYVNFGFWDTIRERMKRPQGHYNRLVENKVIELNGLKSLYSDSYLPEDTFWSIYNKPAYDALKSRYDHSGRLRNLYEKTVLNQ